MAKATHGSIYQSPQWYLATYPKLRRYFATVMSKGQRPVFAALVAKSHLPGTKYSIGHIHRGPVFENVDEAIALWADFDRLLKDEGICAITIQPFWERRSADLLISHLISLGYTVSTNNSNHTETLIIDIRRSKDDIFRQDFSSMRRGRIRKALKLGILVESPRSYEEVQIFWRMYRDMCLMKKIHYWSSDMFNRVYSYSHDYPNNCIFLLGWLKGEILGGSIILKHSKIAEFTKGSSSIKPMRGIPKTELIHWEAIRWAQKVGAHIYDLGGYAPYAEKGSQEWGINMFKKGFTKRRVSVFKPMQKVFKPVPHRIFNFLKMVKKNVDSKIRDVHKGL